MQRPVVRLIMMIGTLLLVGPWLITDATEVADKAQVPRRFDHVSKHEAVEAYDAIWKHRFEMIPETAKAAAVSGASADTEHEDEGDDEEDKDGEDEEEEQNRSQGKGECHNYQPEDAEDDKHKIFGVSSPFAEITILEMCGHRDLYTGNNIQASEVDEFIYHEALVHPGMAAFQHFHGSPVRRIFAAGGGELSIAREALRWPTLEKVVTVDIDKVLVDTIRKWIPSMPGNAHQDPRSEVRIADAVAELNASADGSYDMFVKDLPDAFEAQAAKSFFSKSFYEMIKSKLVAGGVLVDSTGPCNLQTKHKFNGNEIEGEEDDVFLLLYGTLSTVFKHVDVMHIPMTTWFGDHHMYCVYIASDAGFPAGAIPAKIIDELLPMPGPSKSIVGVSPGDRSGLGFYDGKIHSLSFQKSQEVADAFQQAAMGARKKEDAALNRIKMDVSKSGHKEL